MAKIKDNNFLGSRPKKTTQGRGPYRKHGNKGGGPNGSTKSKNYTKKYRGQGR